jgi:CheY-like chemotaxis protein
LIVEDDRLSLIVLRQLLTAQGYEILQSSKGWDGFNRARDEQPDLIVMDIPIIAVTACVTPGDKANALKRGCAAYIAKPVNIGNLLRTVGSFLPSSSRW